MISKPRFWKKHNELHIVTLKNRDPDILDHLFQKMCSGEYISPESSRLSGSITGIQQLTIITQKYNLQVPRLLALHAEDNSTWHRPVTK